MELVGAVGFGAALAMTCVVVTWRTLTDPYRLAEDEALEIAVRRLLFSDKIYQVEQLVPDHVARLRVMMDRLATVVQQEPPE